MPTLRTSRATLGSTALAPCSWSRLVVALPDRNVILSCGRTMVSGGSIVYGADREPTCLDTSNGDMRRPTWRRFRTARVRAAGRHRGAVAGGLLDDVARRTDLYR
jgi:hypothetical protein